MNVNYDLDKEQIIQTKSKRDQYITEIRKSKANEILKSKRMKIVQGPTNKEN